MSEEPKRADARLAVYIEVLVGQNLSVIDIKTARALHESIGKALTLLEEQEKLSPATPPH